MAVQHLLPHLTSAEGAQNSRPTLDSSTLSYLPNLYNLNKSVDIKFSSSDKSYVKVKHFSHSAAFDKLLSRITLNQLVYANSDKRSVVFKQVESVNKLYNILASETVDLVLRKSAAEQLAIVLQGE